MRYQSQVAELTSIVGMAEDPWLPIVDTRRVIRELLFVNLAPWIAVPVRALGQAGLLMIAAVILVACGGSSQADAVENTSDEAEARTSAKGSMTTMEFQVTLCDTEGECEGLYADTEIDLAVDGEPWTGEPIVTADSPLGPYRAIIEVPADAVLTVTPVGATEDIVGDTVEIAVSDIDPGTCSDMSTCPVLIVTLREK